MRIAKNLLLAGAAALALAGGAGLALAQPLHSMMVRLPDGGLAQIQYSGNVPPRVAFVPESPAAEYDHLASPFAMLDRISAQIDRDMDALISDVAMGSPFVNPVRVFDVDMHNLPPDTMQYSVVSTTAGDGNFCTRSMEITRTRTWWNISRAIAMASATCRSALRRSCHSIIVWRRRSRQEPGGVAAVPDPSC